MNLITATNLCKSYNGTLALDNLTFHLKKGEILGLLGPNGAGKTTAIHILLGLLTPSSGEVLVLGFNPLKHRHHLTQKINFSSAYTQLPTNLKIRENLKIFAKLYNVRHASQKIEEVLELFEIRAFQDRVVGALSSGEKTRLNLCKAMLNDPNLLLLDEPTASLDPEMADKVRQILKKIQKEKGIGILFTSHNMFEVEEMCDRILFIDHGKIIEQGTHDEIIKRHEMKNLEEVFIKIVRKI